MHMADALISPTVGGAMWVASGVAIAWSSTRVRERLDDRTVPLMGVMAAFIFAAQMINFSIPGTGSSGHLGGGLLLAILLGPHAAFLAIASVLVVQSLFFADGGLLALGCNIFNLGIFPCFLAYPLLYRPLVGSTPTQGRILVSALLAAVVGLQLGAFAVVLETVLSGISALPFGSFVLLMQPIHLAIGLVEGVATAAVVLFVWRARPEILAAAGMRSAQVSYRPVLVALALATLLTGGVMSWFASGHPDGLEWSMARTSGHEELEAPTEDVFAWLAAVQEKTSFLPDYGFPATGEGAESAAWPAIDPGTSVAGLVGGGLTLLLVVGAGLLLKRRRLVA